MIPGTVLRAGTPDFWSWVQIESVDPDGQVHFRQLDPARPHQHLPVARIVDWMMDLYDRDEFASETTWSLIGELVHRTPGSEGYVISYIADRVEQRHTTGKVTPRRDPGRTARMAVELDADPERQGAHTAMADHLRALAENHRPD